MPILFTRIITILAVPFLALFGIVFLCVRTVLSASMRLIGWQLAWPPVLVEGDQPQPHSHVRMRTPHRQSRASARSLRLVKD